MKNSLTVIFLITQISILFAVEVTLIGSRSDINFLNCEGDVIFPLKYEYENSNVNFKVIDSNIAPPILLIGETTLIGSNLNYETANNTIEKSVKVKSVKTKIQKNNITKNKNNSTSGKQSIAFANIIAMIVSVICGGFIYFARKKYLGK